MDDFMDDFPWGGGKKSWIDFIKTSSCSDALRQVCGRMKGRDGGTLVSGFRTNRYYSSGG
jgi:hypothetical protein